MIIYGIHPADKDLKFLEKINRDFSASFTGYKYLRLEPNYKSHESCISTLEKNKNATLLFFCHALEKSIRGCKIEFASSVLSAKEFNYGTLISAEKNIEVFKKQSIFCLACFSRDLGMNAIKAGANVFLGFGDIPFYIKEKYKADKVEAFVKRELGEIIKRILTGFIKERWTFNKLSINLQLAIDKRRLELLLDKKPGLKVRKEVANVLSRIKGGITMFGDGNYTID
jgi:hypothetical protein